VIKDAGDDSRLTAYTELLLRYNGALNLLSAQGVQDIDRLLADGAAYARSIESLVGPAPTVVDVGSGSGFPGIVIAVRVPNAHVHLVERRRRRAAFLQLAAGRLGLDNVTVHTTDVRALTGICADVVSAQAVTRLGDLTSLTRHLHNDPCLLLSRRGPDWRDELDAVMQVLADENPAGAAPHTAEADSNAASAASPSARAASGTASIDSASDPAATGPVAAVVGEEPLEQSGSLVALRLTGGPACRSSG